ncbi:AFG1/ZapE family ATPase [Streptomyces sp. M10(2022)]
MYAVWHGRKLGCCVVLNRRAGAEPHSRNGPAVPVCPRTTRPRRPSGGGDGAAAALRLGALRYVRARPRPAESDRGGPGAQRVRGRARRAHATGTGKRRFFSRKPVAPTGPRGVYLDGGYGVGKTHLLASLWHATPAAPRSRPSAPSSS